MTQSKTTHGLSSLFRKMALSCSQRRNPARTWLVLVVTIAVSCQALPLEAQVRDWTNTSNGGAYYDVGSNWSPSGAPGASGTARFQQPGTYQVWWDTITATDTPSVGFLQVHHGNATFLNTDTSLQHQLTINGSGGAGSYSDLEIRGEGALTIRGLHLRSLGGAQLFTGGTLTLDGSHSAGTRMSVEGSTGFRVLGNGVNVLAGAVLNSTQTILHGGTATVSGNGSQWNTTDLLSVGDRFFGSVASATLNVEAGGLVSSNFGAIGDNDGSGVVTIAGNGSRWNNTIGLMVGQTGNGTLNVSAGGEVDSGAGTIALQSGSNGTATVTGVGSKWTNSGNLVVGNLGNGTLNVQAGGEVTNSIGIIGNQFQSPGTATVTGAGSKWTNSQSLTVGNLGNGTLNVQAGGEVTNSFGVIGNDNNGGIGSATVTGAGSKWTNSAHLLVGNNGFGTLNVDAGGAVTNTDGIIGIGPARTGIATVTGAGSKWTNSGYLVVGTFGNGTLNIQAGGEVANTIGAIGNESGGIGTATVSGAGSKWTNSAYLLVGNSGTGTLDVLTGGLVTNTDALIANQLGAIGTATVTGAGSKWTNSGFLVVGESGNGTLNVAAGGEVANTNAAIGRAYGIGTATVTGAGSKWTNSGFLNIGDSGTGTLNIYDNGLVTVGGNMSINSASSVNLNGGRFEFGTTEQNSFKRINAASGSLAGNVNLSGLNAASSFTALTNNAVDSSGVHLVNSGTLHGNGLLGSRISNTASGELRAVSGEWLRFAGTNNSNAGRINNFGGVIEFGGSLTNAAGGLITGRGQFLAGAGWINQGNMAFSGTADIVGDVANNSGGLIVTSGNATTTFYDDVVNNGEIRTSQQGSSVFFGSVSGAGNYTGTGSVFFEGDLSPGNSPAVVSFGGNVSLGSGSNTLFELGGLNYGDFDKMIVAGNATILGSLSAAMWDNFQLSSGMEFLIMEIGGTRTGFFTGLGEGSLIGNFNGQDLRISYGRGDGNDISLFTPIPEPTAFALIGMMGLLGLRRTKRVKPVVR